MRDRHATMLSLSVGDGELCGARGARVQRGGADGGDWMRGERVGVGGVHGVGGGERDGADGAEIRRRHVEEGRLQSVGQRAGHGYHHEVVFFHKLRSSILRLCLGVLQCWSCCFLTATVRLVHRPPNSTHPIPLQLPPVPVLQPQLVQPRYHLVVVCRLFQMCPYPENHRPGLTPLEEVQTLARVLKESPRSIGAMGRFFICRSTSELVQLRQKSSVAPAG